MENFRRIVYDPQMDENSAIVLNFGLHFVESTNFTSYKKLIAGLVRVLKNDVTTNGTWRSYRGTVIWKTTTAINKEKASNIHLGHKRFITQQASDYELFAKPWLRHVYFLFCNSFFLSRVFSIFISWLKSNGRLLGNIILFQEGELGNSLAFIRVVSLGLLFAIVLIATNYFHLHCCHHRHYFVTDFYFCPTDWYLSICIALIANFAVQLLCYYADVQSWVSRTWRLPHNRFLSARDWNSRSPWTRQERHRAL